MKSSSRWGRQDPETGPKGYRGVQGPAHGTPIALSFGTLIREELKDSLLRVHSLEDSQ